MLGGLLISHIKQRGKRSQLDLIEVEVEVEVEVILTS
jgi:hypothetical protein